MSPKSLIKAAAVIALILTVSAGTVLFVKTKQIQSINSFEDCGKAGYPVLMSYPAQCNTPDGRHFVQQLTPEEQARLKSLTPTPKVEPQADTTSSWKIYSSSKIEFKYPRNLTLQERVPGFLVLMQDSQNPSSVVMSVDARTANTYDNYAKAVESTKTNLTNSSETPYKNGLMITGQLGPGYGQGTTVTLFLFPYQSKAIEAETTTTNAETLALFKKIISTLTFKE